MLMLRTSAVTLTTNLKAPGVIPWTLAQDGNTVTSSYAKLMVAKTASSATTIQEASQLLSLAKSVNAGIHRPLIVTARKQQTFQKAISQLLRTTAVTLTMSLMAPGVIPPTLTRDGSTVTSRNAQQTARKMLLEKDTVVQ